jgi:hypothetical protein
VPTLGRRSVLEKSIEGRTKAWARRNGYKVIKVHANFAAGIPDDWFFKEWPYVAIIEFKTDRGVLRPIQVAQIADLQKRGYPVIVARSYEFSIAFLEAACIPGTGYPSWNYASMCWISPSPRDGEDYDRLCDHPNPKE